MTPGSSSGSSYLVWDQECNNETHHIKIDGAHKRHNFSSFYFLQKSWFKFLEYFPELINNGFRPEDILGYGVWQFFSKIEFLGLDKLEIYTEGLKSVS